MKLQRTFLPALLIKLSIILFFFNSKTLHCQNPAPGNAFFGANAWMPPTYGPSSFGNGFLMDILQNWNYLNKQGGLGGQVLRISGTQ